MSKKHFFTRFTRKIDRSGIEGAMGRYYSWYRAFVMNNKDPQNLDRLILTIPDLTGDIEYDQWAWPFGVWSGKTRDGKPYGKQMLPQVGDVVWVSFEMGDIRNPIWAHCHPAEKEKPTDSLFNDPNSYWFISPGQNSVVINDTKNTILVTHSGGQKVLIDKDSISLISDEAISLGQEKQSKEPAVIGDTAVDLLNEMLDDLGNIGAISTTTGITSTINTSPEWETFIQKWKQKFNKMKSKKVTLD